MVLVLMLTACFSDTTHNDKAKETDELTGTIHGKYYYESGPAYYLLFERDSVFLCEKKPSGQIRSVNKGIFTHTSDSLHVLFPHETFSARFTSDSVLFFQNFGGQPSTFSK